MDLSLLSSWYWPAGLIIGFVASAPVGPVNILIIQRNLQQNARSATILGLGAALGDALFATIAAFGLGALKIAIHANQAPFRLGGGLFMIVFGLLLWRQAPHLQTPGRPLPKTRHLALAATVMTITNPATLLWFIAAFAMFRFDHLGHANQLALMHSAMLVMGVFCGSMLWWLCINGISQRLRQRLNDQHLLWMNHIVSAALVGFGLFAMLTAY